MPWVMQIWSWVIPILEPAAVCVLAWSVYRQRTVRVAKWFAVYCLFGAVQVVFSFAAAWLNPDLTYYIGEGLQPASQGLALAAIYEVFQRTTIDKARDRTWFLWMNAVYLLLASLLALGVQDLNSWKLLRVVHLLTIVSQLVQIALLTHLLVLIGTFGFYLRRLPLAIVLGMGADAAASLAGNYILATYGYLHFSWMVLLQMISFIFTTTIWMFAVWTQPGETTRLAAATKETTVDWAPAIRELQKIDTTADEVVQREAKDSGRS